MSTIINNPPETENSGGNNVFIIVIVLLVLAAVFVYYGVPAIKTIGTPQINVPTQVEVPDEIDVNINQTQ